MPTCKLIIKDEVNVKFEGLDLEMRKALTAAAANYGCPMLWADGHTPKPPSAESFEGELVFSESDLQLRYQQLAPKGIVDLVVIGCPQASVGEVRTAASFVRSRMELGETIPNQRLWIFTSGHNYEILESDGTIDILEEAGALVLKDTCPIRSRKKRVVIAEVNTPVKIFNIAPILIL